MKYLIQHPHRTIRPKTFLESAYGGVIKWTDDVLDAKTFSTATAAMTYAGEYGVTCGHLVREEAHYTVV